MNDLTTSALAAILAEHKKTHAEDWRLLSEISYGGTTIHTFMHVEHKTKCTTFRTQKDDIRVVNRILPGLNPTLINNLVVAGNSVKHCGDYGQLYWEPETLTACMVLGDGDGQDPGSTFIEISDLLAQAGAKEVLIEAEAGPPEGNFIWLEAVKGITVED